MSERAVHLSRTADRQITEVIDILAICDEAALRLPCPGREELGDGSVAACARHTAHNYRRIGRFLATTDRLSAGHTTGAPGAHRLPRFLRTLGHDAVEQSRHGPDGHDHHEQYKAENTSPADLIEQLSTISGVGSAAPPPRQYPCSLSWQGTSCECGRRGTMRLVAPITTSIEVARPAEQVFAYVTDPSTMHEWQQGCVSGHMDAPTTRVGSKCTTVRRIGGREREVTTEITAYDPPQRWADRGVDGPIRAIVAVRVEPLAGGSRSRLTIELDFTGHGIGKLLVPLVVRPQAARGMPENMRRLKQRLELRPQDPAGQSPT